MSQLLEQAAVEPIMDQQGSRPSARAIARRIWKGPRLRQGRRRWERVIVSLASLLGRQGRPWFEASMLSPEAQVFGELERLSSSSGQ